MFQINRTILVASIGAAFALVTPMLASAHEDREIANGRYSVDIGFITEPAYTGLLNGLSLEVTDNTQVTPADAASGEEATGAPVDGLKETLQAEVIVGEEKMELTLEPRFRVPGAYDAWFVPMAAGDYTFHIFGTIGDTAVDETFTSSPEGFSTVVDQGTIQFPKTVATSGAAPVFGTVDDGASMNTGAAGGAIAGIVAGAAGLFLLQRRKRRHAPALAVTRAGAGD